MPASGRGVHAQGFNVSQVSHLSLGQSGDIAANGDIVFVPQWFDGVAIIDVSTPATPNLLTTWDHPTDDFRCLDARPLGNHVYLSAEFGSTFGLISLDVTDPSVPTIEVEFDPSTYPEFVHNLTIANDMLFLSGYGSNGGNVIVDVANPTSPSILATIDTDIHDNTVVGNKLYISGGFEATYIYDIMTPSSPVQDAVFSPNTPDSVFYQHNAYPIPGTSYLVSTEELEVATGAGPSNRAACASSTSPCPPHPWRCGVGVPTARRRTP